MKSEMKHTLGDLNAYLFEQLDALSNADLTAEELQNEISRSKAVGSIAKDIISNASLVLDAKKAYEDNLSADKKIPKMLEG